MVIDIEGRSRDEKLDLIGRLWGRLAAAQEDLPLPDWHHEVLNHRFDEFERDGDYDDPADQILARLRGPNDGRPPT